MNINELTASKIKELRSKLGLTAEAMAKDLGISKTAYSQLENAKVEITLNRIESIANIYSVPISELIPNAGNNNQTHHSGSGSNFVSNGTVNNFFGNQEEHLQSIIQELNNVLSSMKAQK